MDKIDRSEITPEHLYLSRRRFIKLGAAAATSAVLAACRAVATEAPPTPTTPADTPTPAATATEETDGQPTATPGEAAGETVFPPLSASEDELGDPLTAESDINSFNNFYEFSLDKSAVAVRAQGYKTSPWSVEVGGLVENPRTFSMDELLAYPQEERIYRMRCVEGWSMVIPWIGFSLAKLLDDVQPTDEAQFVRFQTIYDPEHMPGQMGGSLPWPYVEGLRLDEAMHDLTILATGLYGKPLKPQTGAPIRLVVPWKYGFKNIKSIVKIDLVAEMPTSTWMDVLPHEYGFYANVNPDVSHPRWSQATERRIGETRRRRTLLFNGYEDEVAQLYEGMDLKVWY
jgi:sulfoxide reductase catalytic subunit YedY